MTLVQLKRGRDFATKYFLCGVKEETIDHILVHCSKVRVLCDLILALVGVNWVFPLTVKETLLSWSGSFVRKKCKKAWMAAPLYLFGTVWHERNIIVFYNEVLSLHRMKITCIVEGPCPRLISSFGWGADEGW